jgi:hypothetical protein
MGRTWERSHRMFEALVGLEVRASSRDGFSTHLGELRLVTDFTFVNNGAGLTTLGRSF